MSLFVPTKGDIERFEQSYRVGGPNDCWPWKGYVSPRGYVYFRSKGRNISARRFAWELSHGPVPSGMVVRPACGNRACMNPQHLKIIDRSDSEEQTKRFWDRVRIVAPDECWEWQGSVNPRFGYGQVRAFGEFRAHRVAWVLTNGPIPDGLLVCHRCDNRKCCNPDHLFLGSYRDNNHDTWRKGKGLYPAGVPTR